MVAIILGADNGFFYAGQVMHFSSPFTVFLIYHKHAIHYLAKKQMLAHLLFIPWTLNNIDVLILITVSFACALNSNA